MKLSFRRKLQLGGIAVALVGLLALGEAARLWWYRGWSVGTRTGYLRKISVKGPPYCKYLSGEMVLQSAAPGVPSEVWEFSVDDPSDRNPLVAALHEAEKSGARTTLKYRQDLYSLWRCTPSEYFVTGVDR